MFLQEQVERKKAQLTLFEFCSNMYLHKYVILLDEILNRIC